MAGLMQSTDLSAAISRIYFYISLSLSLSLLYTHIHISIISIISQDLGLLDAKRAACSQTTSLLRFDFVCGVTVFRQYTPLRYSILRH